MPAYWIPIYGYGRGLLSIKFLFEPVFMKQFPAHHLPEPAVTLRSQWVAKAFGAMVNFATGNFPQAAPV